MEVTTSSRTAVAVGWGRTLEDKLTTLLGVVVVSTERVYSAQVRRQIE